MDVPILHELPFDGGKLALSATHLYLLRGQGVMVIIQGSLALAHLSEADTEHGPSFRHRTLGLIASIVLFIATGVLGGLFVNDAVPDKIAVLMGLGAVMTLFFSAAFLIGVLRSRPVEWLTFRYGTTPRRFALPGTAREDVERFVHRLRESRPGQSLAYGM